jgi:hypothetical protein
MAFMRYIQTRPHLTPSLPPSNIQAVFRVLVSGWFLFLSSEPMTQNQEGKVNKKMKRK